MVTEEIFLKYYEVSGNAQTELDRQRNAKNHAEGSA